MLLRKTLAFLRLPVLYGSFLRKTPKSSQSASSLEDGSHVTYYEPAHDALISSWKKMSSWQREETAWLPLQFAITQAALAWKRHKGGLWTLDPRLRVVLSALRNRPHVLSQLEADFIRRSTTRQLNISAAVIATAILSVIAAINFYMQRADAIRLRNRSLVQALANLAPNQMRENGQDERALLLAREAFLLDKKLGTNQQLNPVYSSLRQVLTTPTYSWTRTGQNSSVDAVALSDDGRWAASGGYSGRVLLWDLKSRSRPPLQLKLGNRSWDDYPNDLSIETLKFHPDSQTLVGVDATGRVLIWQVQHPDISPRVLTKVSELSCCRFINAGKILAIGTDEGEVELFSWPQFKPLPPHLKLDFSVKDIDYGGNPLSLLAMSDRGSIATWNPHQGLRTLDESSTALKGGQAHLLGPGGSFIVGKDFYGHAEYQNITWKSPPVFSNSASILPQERDWGNIALSGDGKRFVMLNSNGYLVIAQRNSRLRRFDIIAQDYLTDSAPKSLATNPSGDFIIAGNNSGSVTFIDMAADKGWEPPAFHNSATGAQPSGITVNAQGNLMAITVANDSSTLWKITDSSSSLLPPPDSIEPAQRLQFLPNSSTLLSLGAKKSQIWDYKKRRTSANLAWGGRCFAWNWAEGILAVGSSFTTQDETPTEDEEDHIEVSAQQAEINSATPTPNIDLFHFNNLNQSFCRLTDISDDLFPPESPLRMESHPVDVVFDTRHQHLISGSSDGLIRFWSWQEHLTRPSVLAGTSFFAPGKNRGYKPPPPGPVGEPNESLSFLRALAISPDSRSLGVARDDGTVEVWNLDRLMELETADLLPADPKNPYLAGRVALDQRVSPHILRPSASRINAVAFSPEGHLLAAAGEDGLVRLWDTMDYTQPPVTLGQRGDAIRCLCWFRRGGYDWLVAGDASGLVHQYRASATNLADEVCKRVSTNLSAQEWTDFVGSNPAYESTCPAIESSTN